MRYDEKNEKIILPVGEAVSLSMAKSLSEAAANRAGAVLSVGEGGARLSFCRDGLCFEILTDAREEGGVLRLSRTLDSDPRRLGKMTLSRLRGEVFLSALAYLSERGGEAVEVVLSLSCPDLGVDCERR